MDSSQKRKREDFPLSREDSTRPLTNSSLVTNAEEASFPRGGASVLTPLELKQVANEAANDILFGNKGPGGSVELSRPKKKKKTVKSAENEKSKDALENEFADLIEHINFKNLKVGSLLLGQITAIGRNDLCVSFTDNISGYVSIANISEQMTGILKTIDDEMEDDNEKGEEYESDDDSGSTAHQEKDLPSLVDHFKLGQWLRCSIMSNSALESQPKKQIKKRIELSIEPSVVNEFTEEDIDKYTAVQCSVKSIEDHGAALDVGVEGLTGFISKKDFPDFESLMPGSVFLGNVHKKSGRSIIVNLDFSGKSNKISKISAIEAVVPGQVVDFLCENIKRDGVAGKVLGLVNGFLDVNNIHILGEDELKKRFSVGSNIRARIVASLTNKNGDRTVLLSTLQHTLILENKLKSVEALQAFPAGYILDSCTVAGRDSEYLYLNINDDQLGQVHHSRVGGIEPTGSIKARVLGYNNVDNLFELSTDPNTLKLKYLRTKDIPVGEIIPCEIIKVSSGGINLKIFGGQFTAFVPSLHISDTKLVYPERKFKIGSKVKGRVLNIDSRGNVFITLKKSLVNADDDSKIITSFSVAEQILKANQKTLAVVQSFQPKGCSLLFFGGIRGFLPTAEISEVYVKRPEDHLRLGQTVIIKLLEVDEERCRIIATCKVSNEQAEQQKNTIEQMTPGRSIIEVAVVEKTKDSLVVEMNQLGLRGVVYVGHLSDLRIEQNRAQLKKVKIGAVLKGLVIDKDTRTQVFNLTLKESLIKDAERGTLPLVYEDVKSQGETTPMHGYIKSISEKGIFVAFNGKFVGLVLPSYAVESRDVDISKSFYPNQSVKVYLLRTDDEHQRFLLTLKKPKRKENEEESNFPLQNPVDESAKSFEDLSNGKVIAAKIKGVKKNQLNVLLAENLHGRVDISEVFDTYDDIKNKKQPLDAFKSGDIIRVKVIGSHDIKSHKFLPITHSVNKASVLELTMKPSKLRNSECITRTIENLTIGEEVVGFVNNYSSNSLWLTISPSLRAKISVLDLSDDSTTYSDSIEDQFPFGCALKVTISGVDTEHGFFNVTRRKHIIQKLEDVSTGDKIPARIVKVTDKYVLLALGDNVTGISFATDALDDFSVPLELEYKGMVNQTIPSEVLSIEPKSKKIRLSLRSSDPKTPSIKSHKDLKQGDIIQALVKAVTDKGVFVYLSSSIEAFVPVSKLSDSYLKDWKKFYQPMQPVVGKVIKSDDDLHILLTLRESEVNGNLQILKSYDDIKVGEIFNGNVKNVTDFGVFVKLDNTVNVTGLAHRSEIADETPRDLPALFGVGDRVKVIVLKVNPDKKQLSLSLKASHFSENKPAVEEDASHTGSGPSEVNVADEDEEMQDIMEVNYSDDDSEGEEAYDDIPPTETVSGKSTDGLSLSADFDWTASILDQAKEESDSDDGDEDFTNTKRSRRHKNKKQLIEDKTIDINTRAPESVGDFERLIMGNPNSSIVWMNYIAFQLQLSEIEKAREVAERALKTINFREENEKLNIWIAMLNLENTFGNEDSLEEVFKRACQYMDSFTIHNKLLSIYHISQKYTEEAQLYKITAKKFGSERVSIWVSWGDFLLGQNEAEEARSILSKALNALPKRSHIDVVRKFAQLEFAKGNPERGRSLFEGLIADTPKRIDLWNVYLDQEIKINEKKKAESVFERVLTKKLTRKQAKFFFNKWLQFEEEQNDLKAAEYVKAKAVEYTERHPKVSGV